MCYIWLANNNIIQDLSSGRAKRYVDIRVEALKESNSERLLSWGNLVNKLMIEEKTWSQSRQRAFHFVISCLHPWVLLLLFIMDLFCHMTPVELANQLSMGIHATYISSTISITSLLF